MFSINKILKALDFMSLLYISWVVALFGLVGSIIYSDVLHIPICPLCWYQRISMYPLAAIYPVGIMLKDKRAFVYALPLIIVGLLLSLYQVLLQAGIVGELLTFCESGYTVSCAEITFRLFGLVTIPQQALMGFGVLGLLGVWGLKSNAATKD